MVSEVAYAVVTFRSAADVGACLDALASERAAASAAPGDRPIVVVDNASDDGSASIARAHPAGPIVLERATNDGFGTACNVAAAAVDSAAIFFVNPDAVVPPGTTGRLLAALADEPAIGAVGPAILDPAGGYTARSAGREPSGRSAVGHFLLLARVPGLRRWFPAMHLPASAEAQDVDWLSGAALLVRRTAFEAVGGFDERMFLYMEDVDLCRRLREAGWRIRYVPSATVDHAMGRSQGRESVETWYRAFGAYVRRQHGPASAIAAGLAAFVGMGLRAVVYRLTPGRRIHAERMRRAALAAAGSLTGRAG